MAATIDCIGPMRMSNLRLQTSSKFNSRELLILCAVVALFVCQMLTTAEARTFTPRASATALWTDNLRLTEDEIAESDFAAEVVPGLNMTLDGERVQFFLDGEAQFIFYNDNSDNNSVFGNGIAGLDLEILKDNFFIYSFADLTQTVIDPNQPISGSNLPITNNRTDQRILEVNPRWVSQFIGNDLSISYQLGRVDYDADDLQDTVYNRISSFYGQGPKADGFSLNVTHDYANYEYETPPKARYQTLALNADNGFGNGFSR